MPPVSQLPSPNTKPRVVIIGAGFGGLAVARGLAHSGTTITLVDRQNHHVFQPLLYQVATAGLSPADIAAPIRSIVKRQKETRVLLAEVKGVDADQRRVFLSDGGTLDYDALVIATGAATAILAATNGRSTPPASRRSTTRRASGGAFCSPWNVPRRSARKVCPIGTNI